jgi:pimeloyl-ACP methyl ester carboxylesterase
MPIVPLRGIELYYESHGHRGDPTVLVHGSLTDSSGWARVLPGLARGVSVLAYDRRGYGRSTPGARPTPVRTDAEDLAALLEATDFYPVHLVGHSYGAAVALRLASERPDLVRSLALHEPPYVGLLADRPATAEFGRTFLAAIDPIAAQVAAGAAAAAARTVVDAFSVRPGAWDRLPEAARRTGAAAMDRWVEEYRDGEALRPDPAGLRETLVPVLLTVGEESPAFLREISALLAADLPNATLRSIPGTGHTPQLSAPDPYVGLLLSFLLERNVPQS